MTELGARTLTGVLDEATSDRLVAASLAMTKPQGYADSTRAVEALEFSAILDLLANAVGRDTVRAALAAVADDILRRADA